MQQSVAPAPLAGKIFRSRGSYLARPDFVARYERIEEGLTEYLTRAVKLRAKKWADITDRQQSASPEEEGHGSDPDSPLTGMLNSAVECLLVAAC